MNFDSSNEILYNNPDSFAMAFDSAWKDCSLEKHKDLNIEERIDLTFEKIKSHPFLIKNPNQSKNIAIFRIKLLGLS
tara:strand:+ start:808 stop:1038 length:231 start_codon:yes stop_codon:yes gene_type:complete